MKDAAPKPEGYETKKIDYFGLSRPEMLPFIPATCRRFLDVGCGSGGFGQTLKQTRNAEVWGVEPVTAAAEVARTRLDKVIEAPFMPGLDLPERSFDCVIFNDVLEHVFDPVGALRYAATLLAPGGVVVASIPNIRHFPTLWSLVVRGEWIYMDSGILDRTHLRFFTGKSVRPLFADAGLDVITQQGINKHLTLYKGGPRWRYFVALNTLLFGAISDMAYLQYAVVARPTRSNA